jgi:hypothetical protein
MIESTEIMLSAKEGDAAVNIALKCPLFPSISTYGNNNVGVSTRIGLNRLYHDLRGDELYILPRNYYAAKSIATNSPHPVFDPKSSEFFRENGEEITVRETIPYGTRAKTRPYKPLD